MISRSTRSLVLLLTFCTGFSGLVYEVVWQSYLSNLLGSQAQAAALIIAVFLGGLSTGYLVFGRFTRGRSPRALVAACGWIEVAIGAWALLFPALFNAIWNSGLMASTEGTSFILDFLVCVGLIGLPTVMMGGTLPLLTQGLAEDLTDAARFHTKIYTVNTGGAFLGCLLAGFLILPRLGLPVTVLSMGVLNVIAGLGLLLLSRGLSKIPPPETAPRAEPREAPGDTRLTLLSACSIAFLAGLYSISAQTVLIRIVGISAGSSQYSFSMVVSAFILMLALGAWRLSGETRNPIPCWMNQLLVVGGLVLLYAVIPYWPYLSHIVRSLLTSQPPNFYVFYTEIFIGVCLFLAIPVGAMGSTLPLLFRDTRDRMGDLGRNVGILYGWNTFGCVLGAVIGGHLLLYLYDLDVILLLCCLCSIVTLLIMAFAAARRVRVIVISSALVFMLLLALLPAWRKEVFAMGTFRATSAMNSSYKGFEAFYREFLSTRTLRAYKDDPNTTVAVVGAAGGGKSLSIYVNGKSDGSTAGGDRVTTKLIAHLPALLNTSSSRKAAVIGFGTGLTAGALTLHPDIDSIDLLEIAPFIRTFAPLFDKYNHQASKSPKLHWHIGDAYRFLIAAPAQYGVIISEPSNPWVTGIERLYTSEFYEIIKTKLAPGGVYAQWMHGYSISENTLGMVFNTLAHSFSHAHIFVRDFDLIILGTNSPLDRAALTRMAERFGNPVITNDLNDIGFTSIPQLLGSELWLPLERFSKSGVHTLNFPKLSYAAGYDFFLNTSAPPDKLVDNPVIKPWSRSVWPRTLLASWIEMHPETAAPVELLKAFCKTDAVKFNQLWRELPYRCKAASVAWALAASSPVAGPAAEDIELLRRFLASQTGPITPAESLDAAQKGVRFFSDYGSPFIQLSPDRLTTYAAPCYGRSDSDALRCREAIIEGFIANGFLREADNELRRLAGDNPAQTGSERFKALVQQLRERLSPT